jgi:hypothetical protein
LNIFIIDFSTSIGGILLGTLRVILSSETLRLVARAVGPSWSVGYNTARVLHQHLVLELGVI